jgi:hypothetical protein
MAAGDEVRNVAGMAATRSPDRVATTRRSSADGQLLGILLVLGGIAWLVQQTGVVDLSVTTVLSALLLVLGVGLVVTARSHGGAGLVLVGLALTVVLASASAVDVGLLQRGVGERTFRPTTAAAIDEPFQLGLGSLTVDLTGVDAEDLAGERVRVQMGVGEVLVLLPPADEVAVEIVAEARAGEVDLLSSGSEDGGTNIRKTHRDPSGAAASAEVLHVDLDVGLGSIQVVRRGRP